MHDDVPIKNGIIIPGHELIITASRSGGAGGQHVNKTNSRITVRWNVQKTNILDDEQKKRVLEKLQTDITSEGDLIIHQSTSRSQHQNKQLALLLLAQKVRNALHIPKKRIKAQMPTGAKETRLQTKRQHSFLKKMRSKKFHDD